MTVRIEHDGLGEMPVPQDAYYGIMTVRSQKAYDVGPRTLDDYPLLIKATALIKSRLLEPIARSEHWILSMPKRLKRPLGKL